MHPWAAMDYASRRFDVSTSRQRGRIGCTMNQKLKLKAGFSLTELLCVMAIILILSALYLPAIAKAYHRVRTFLGGMSG